FTFLQLRTERARVIEDITTRAAMVTASLQAVVQPVILRGDKDDLARIVDRFSQAGPIAGIGVYNLTGHPLYVSAALKDWLPAPNPMVLEALGNKQNISVLQPINGKTTHFYAAPVLSAGKPIAALVVAHDASDLDNHLRQVWHHNFALFL